MNYRNIMNHKSLGVAFLATTPFVVRCKPSAEQSATEARDTAAQQFGRVKQEAKEAAQEMKPGFQQAGQWVNCNIAV